jgi:hypothetical protein
MLFLPFLTKGREGERERQTQILFTHENGKANTEQLHYHKKSHSPSIFKKSFENVLHFVDTAYGG